MTELRANKIKIDQIEPAPTGKPVLPVPLRYWWLKRILVVSGALLAVLLGIRLWWGWDADRRLQSEIDRIIAAGEPIYPADFDSPHIRPEDNAAKLYLEAETVLIVGPAQGDFVRQLLDDRAQIRERMDEVEPFVKANAEALQLVRRAGELPEVDWKTRVRSPAINSLLPSLSMHRHLARILSVTATYHAERGNDVEALTTMIDALRFFEAADSKPFLATHLTAIACRALVVSDIEYIAPTLAVAAQTPEREVVTLLITRLLDEMSNQAALARSMQGQRMLVLDMAQMVIRGDAGIGSLATPAFAIPSLLERAIALPLTPMLKLDALAGIRHGSAFVDGAWKPDWYSALAMFPPEPVDWPPLQRLTRPLSGWLISSLARSVSIHFRHLADSRMAAIALAIRLYEVDHGRRPETLAELVPEYLSAVPLDPLAENDQPIGYLPNAPKPILYSVGENGTDDGGSYTVHSSGGLDWKILDRPFFLDGDRPTRTKNVDDASEPDDDAKGEAGDSQ